MSQNGFTFVKEREGISEFVLDANGLKVLLAPNKASEVATVMIVYHVGSRNEAVGYTGSTHFLEHMMFKGSKNFGNYAEVLTPLGGDYNATTSYDRTNYFAKVPRRHLKQLIAMEADRMRNLKLRREDRDSEMTVVRNEFERGQNSPYSVLYEELGACAFRAHPYHHPIIGWLSDVENVPLERMQAFYDQFYWPNNATIMVTGAFTIEEALGMIMESFGSIPSSPAPIPVMYTVEPPQEGERRVTVERTSTEPGMVLVGYRVPGTTHADSAALAVIADILGGSSSKASRFYAALIKSGKAVEAFVSGNELKDEFLFRAGAIVHPEGNLAELEQALLSEMDRLCHEPVSEEELSRVKKAYRKRVLFATDNQMSFLSSLCEAEAAGNWEDFLDNTARYEAVTAEMVQAAAKRYFVRKNRTVGAFTPIQPGQSNQSSQSGQADTDQPEAAVTASEDKAAGGFTYEGATVTKVYPNGMKVQVLTMESARTVGISLSMLGGDTHSPAEKPLTATLTAMMLNRGAKHASATEMAAMLEEMGASISFSCDEFRVGSRGKVVPEDLGVYIALLGDCVRNPLFPESELEQVKALLGSNLSQSLSDTGSLASGELSRRIYAAGTPYHQLKVEDLLANLDGTTVEDLKQFHASHYTPKSVLITIAGNIAPEAAFHAVELALGSWQGGEAPAMTVPPQSEETVKSAGGKHVVFVPEMTSCDIRIGRYAPVRMGTPEFFVAKLANDALGENTLSARLGLSIRVKHGLTYGISSHFEGALLGNGGWMVELTVHPDNVNRAIELVNAEIERYLAEGVSQEELDRWVENVVGGFQVSLDNPLAVASTLNRYTFYLGDGGARYMDELPAGYRKVTVEAVNDYARRMFKPEALTTVVAGTVRT